MTETVTELYDPTDEEIEQLGQRLDHARQRLGESKPNTWSQNYWLQVETELVRQWRKIVSLRDVGFIETHTRTTGVEIDYAWFEKDRTLRQTWFDHMWIRWNRQTDLEQSWNRAQEQMLQRARLGLA